MFDMKFTIDNDTKIYYSILIFYTLTSNNWIINSMQSNKKFYFPT